MRSYHVITSRAARLSTVPESYGKHAVGFILKLFPFLHTYVSVTCDSSILAEYLYQNVGLKSLLQLLTIRWAFMRVRVQPYLSRASYHVTLQCVAKTPEQTNKINTHYGSATVAGLTTY